MALGFIMLVLSLILLTAGEYFRNKSSALTAGADKTN